MIIAPNLEPDWLLRARREIGVKERPGVASHPRILQYFAATRIAPVKDDSTVPWCAAFVGFVLEESGLRSTKSAAARSYLTWGVELVEPQPGCVVVLERHDPGNPAAAHVGFYVSDAPNDQILVLSGNHNNAVCISPYPKDRVRSYRWPEV